MRIVLDTNVLVSALLRPGSRPAQVLQVCARGEVTLLLDSRILREYATVLARPKFQIPPDITKEVLELLTGLAEYVESEPWRHPVPDPDDLPFLEVAVSGHADALVTGNARDYPRTPPPPLRILDPAAFLDFLGAG